MICTSKEWDTCREERLGCEGCFYDSLSNEEVEQCIKELTEVRPEKLNDKALRLFKAIMQIIDERDELKVERDYYKREYSLYNKTLEEAGKILCKRGE